jgi:hypothetical protein
VIAFTAEHGVPWLLWVRAGTDDALLAAGRAAGLRGAGGPPSTGTSPIEPIDGAPPGLEIIEVDDEAGMRVHRDLAARGFDAPASLFETLTSDASVDDPGFAILIGRLDGAQVSTSLVSVTGTTAGIYNVATPEEHRRKGYVRALTGAVIEAGVRRGCDHAILQSSEAGRSVYESLGFEFLGRYVQLEGPPD